MAAKDLVIAGATFPAVPYVTIPVDGGGSANYVETSDATATADKILRGFTAYANGQLITGTAEGGGGATNLMQGSFTLTQETAGAYRITIPYHGTGYPIATMIYVSGGPYNPDTDFYSAINRYAVSCWMLCKSVQDVAPTYQTTGPANQGTVVTVYKSSTSNASSYNRGGGQNTNIYSPTDAAGNIPANVARFRNATTMSLYMKEAGSSLYGFAQNVTYDYIVVYSE